MLNKVERNLTMAKNMSVKKQINRLGETIYEYRNDAQLTRDDCNRLALFKIFKIESDRDYLDRMDHIRESW